MEADIVGSLKVQIYTPALFMRRSLGKPSKNNVYSFVIWIKRGIICPLTFQNSYHEMKV